MLFKQLIGQFIYIIMKCICTQLDCIDTDNILNKASAHSFSTTLLLYIFAFKRQIHYSNATENN